MHRRGLNSIRMTIGFIGLGPANEHGEIGNERTSVIQRKYMIRELVTKRESGCVDGGIYQNRSSATNTTKNRSDEASLLDAAMVTIHTGWYVDRTQELKT